MSVTVSFSNHVHPAYEACSEDVPDSGLSGFLREPHIPYRSQKWQARRDSNPQHPDLESGALAIRATGLSGRSQQHLSRLLRFPVQLMGPAELAVFFHLQPILHGPFILGRRVVPLLAVRTGQGNDISHDKPTFLHQWSPRPGLNW